MKIGDVLDIVDLVDGLLSILSLYAQRIAALFIVGSPGNRSLEVELPCVLILGRGWMVNANDGPRSKVDLIVSVTVCVVLDGVHG